jgi:hypothetical protein
MIMNYLLRHSLRRQNKSLLNIVDKQHRNLTQFSRQSKQTTALLQKQTNLRTTQLASQLSTPCTQHSLTYQSHFKFSTENKADDGKAAKAEAAMKKKADKFKREQELKKQ